MTNKTDKAPKKRLTIKDIERHLKHQDLTTANAVFFAGFLWSFSLVMMALSLLFAREGVSPEILDTTFLIMFSFGCLILAYIWFRWSRIRKYLIKRIEEE